MSDLVSLVQEAHGGYPEWKKVRGLTVILTLGGYLFEIKGHPDGLRSAHVFIDAQKPGTIIWPFPHRRHRGHFAAGRVWLQSDAAARGQELAEPRHAYACHTRSTPWNDLQFLYSFYDLLRFVARVDNYSLTCLWTSIEIAVLLEHADCHTGDDRRLVFCCFHFRHPVEFSLLVLGVTD